MGGLACTLFWPVLGVLIGLDASRKRGFPQWQGVIGGILLGLLSPLMYAMSDRSSKRCAFCKSVIDKTATVCPRCTREQP